MSAESRAPRDQIALSLASYVRSPTPDFVDPCAGQKRKRNVIEKEIAHEPIAASVTVQPACVLYVLWAMCRDDQRAKLMSWACAGAINGV